MYFRGDLLSHVYREVGFALVPNGDTLSWLLLADLRVPQRALSRVSKIVTEYHETPSATNIAKESLERTGVYQAFRMDENGERRVNMCWSLESSTLMLSNSCETVSEARAALLDDKGIDTLPSIQSLLAQIPDESSMSMIIRPYTLMARTGVGRSEDAPYASEHVIAGGIKLDSAHIELSGNIPVLSAAYFALAQPGAIGGEATACDDFIAVACAEIDPDTCDDLKRTIGSSSATACKTGLRTLQALRAPPKP